MSSAKLKLSLYLVATALLAGCGAPGVPEPPSLELARPVRDLKAFRKGNEVRLTWSVPTETTDRQNFRHAGKTQICRAIGSPLRECGDPISIVVTPTPASVARKSRFRQNLPQAQVAPEASYTDHLSAALQMESPTSNLVYAVDVLNSYGRSAGMSNQVQVPSAPVLPPPANFSAMLTPHGVKLTWNAVSSVPAIPGLRYAYRVYRRDIDTNQDAIAGELQAGREPGPMVLDTGFQWEKTYDYRLTVVTFVDQGGGQQVEGNDSPVTRVVAHDVFPPATPTGLQAVFSGPGQRPSIDLIWAANSESDFAGSNIYPREQTTEPAKINAELIKTPAFRDSDVLAGHAYFYSVSAVDERGNESTRSEEASEVTPDQ